MSDIFATLPNLSTLIFNELHEGNDLSVTTLLLSVKFLILKSHFGIKQNGDLSNLLVDRLQLGYIEGSDDDMIFLPIIWYREH